MGRAHRNADALLEAPCRSLCATRKQGRVVAEHVAGCEFFSVSLALFFLSSPATRLYKRGKEMIWLFFQRLALPLLQTRSSEKAKSLVGPSRRLMIDENGWKHFAEIGNISGWVARHAVILSLAYNCYHLFRQRVIGGRPQPGCLWCGCLLAVTAFDEVGGRGDQDPCGARSSDTATRASPCCLCFFLRLLASWR